MKEPIFEIIDGDRHYKVYLDGHVEGFGENAYVVNNAYNLAVAQSSNRQASA
jgi:hypothetical protein